MLFLVQCSWHSVTASLFHYKIFLYNMNNAVAVWKIKIGIIEYLHTINANVINCQTCFLKDSTEKTTDR